MGKAVSTSAHRVLGPVVDIGLGALDTQVMAGMAYLVGASAIRTKLSKNAIVLNADEFYLLQRRMAANNWGESRRIIQAAADRYGKTVK